MKCDSTDRNGSVTLLIEVAVRLTIAQDLGISPAKVIKPMRRVAARSLRARNDRGFRGRALISASYDRIYG